MEIIAPGRLFDFMGKRRWFIGFSGLLVVLSVVLCFSPGLRMGTDFRGGTEVEVAFTVPVSVADVRRAVQTAGFHSPEVVVVERSKHPNHFLIRVQEVSALSEGQKSAIRERLCADAGDDPTSMARCPTAARASEVKFSPGGDKISVRYEVEPDLKDVAQRLGGVEGVRLRKSPELVGKRDNKVEILLQSKGDQLLGGLREQLGADVVPSEALRVEWIGPKAGAQLRDAAIKSVLISLLFIVAYVAIRFDLRFAPGGILSLVHDVVIAMGAIALTQREFTLSTVAALLTIVGYSINDTVVVYDRIRENLVKHRKMAFVQIINLSISEMLGRTFITSGVTALSLIAFLWWGTGVLRDFAFTLLVGMAAGVYSTIYIAAPATEWIDRKLFRASASKTRTVSRKRTQKRPDAVV